MLKKSAVIMFASVVGALTFFIAKFIAVNCVGNGFMSKDRKR
jgi:hypothetical protein